MALTKAHNRMIAGGSVNVLDFGATGDGVTDDTAAIQNAIYYALDNNIGSVYAPSGVYSITSIQLFRDSGLNNRAARGKIKLHGDGSMYIADLTGSTSDKYGTVFQSTLTSGNIIVVANGNTGQRDIWLENLTVISESSGYAIYADYCPDFFLDTVSVSCGNVAGSAVYAKNAWGGLFRNCVFAAKSSITSTGSGLEFSMSLFAGTFTVENCWFEYFDKNIFMNSGANHTSFSITNTVIEFARSYGIYCTAPLWNLILDNLYFEANATNHIKIAPSGDLTTLQATGLFFLGGSTTASFTSGASIDLTNVETFALDAVKCFRPWQSLLNCASNVESGSINNLSFQHDAVANLPTGPLYVVDGAGLTANVEVSNAYITPTSKIEINDVSTSKVSAYNPANAWLNALALNGTVFTSLSAAIYNMNAASPRPIIVYVTATGGGASAVTLPSFASVSNGDTRIIANDAASTQGVNIRDSAGSSIGLTLSAGQSALCIADTVNSKWIAMIMSSVTYGP